MKPKLIRILGLFGITVLLTSCGGVLGSESSEESDWPSKAIHINVHADAGNLDSAVRQIAPELSNELGVDVVVDNRPGGGQEVSQKATLSQPSDGYTVQTVTSSTSFGMALGQITARPDDWKFVKSLQQEPAAIAVPKDSEMKSIKDFVAALKDPDKDIDVGGYQNDGYMRYVLYQLAEMADFESKWIPIETTDRVATSLQGQHIDAAVMTPSSALSAVDNGEVRLIGIASNDRSEYYPKVETFKEQGYEIEESLYRGLIVKSDTPDDIVDRLIDATDKAVESSEWQTYQESNRQSNDTRTAEEMDEVFDDEVDMRKEFLEDIGVR